MRALVRDTVRDAVRDSVRDTIRDVLREELTAYRAESDLQGAVKSVKQVYSPVATPSKRELARQWLVSHPLDRERTSRDLAESVQPQGVKISHATWNYVLNEFRE